MEMFQVERLKLFIAIALASAVSRIVACYSFSRLV